MAQEDEYAEQDRIWAVLHERISRVLRQFGTEDHFGKGDYLLVDDNYGWQRHIVEIHKLHMLKPEVVAAVQPLLREFPGWEVNIAVDIPGTEQTWPNMGITVREDSVVDDLQRQYLPAEYQSLHY